MQLCVCHSCRLGATGPFSASILLDGDNAHQPSGQTPGALKLLPWKLLLLLTRRPRSCHQYPYPQSCSLGAAGPFNASILLLNVDNTSPALGSSTTAGRSLGPCSCC